MASSSTTTTTTTTTGTTATTTTTPDFLTKILFWKRRNPHAATTSPQIRSAKRRECIAKELRSIIVWDNPIKSLLCLIGVNVLFWFLVYTQFKFYGLAFIALLTISLCQLWNEFFRSSSSVTTVDPVSGRDSVASSSGSPSSFDSRHGEATRCPFSGLIGLRSACDKLKRLRNEQPGTFCAATCATFLMLSFVGRCVSGPGLLYTLLMSVMTVPGICIRLVPSHVFSSFVQFIHSSHKDSESDKAEDDYLPDASKENMELLQLAGDLGPSRKDDEDEVKDFLLERISARTDETSGSSISKLSLYPDASIPSVDSSLDFLDFDMGEKRKKKTTSKGDDSDEMDDSDSSDINFKSKHFNGDSSDDDDDDFATGLSLTDAPYDDVDRTPKSSLSSPAAAGATGIASVGLNLLAAGANAITSAMKSSRQTSGTTAIDKRDSDVRERAARESSSDTESFELISEEDM